MPIDLIGSADGDPVLPGPVSAVATRRSAAQRGCASPSGPNGSRAAGRSPRRTPSAGRSRSRSSTSGASTAASRTTSARSSRRRITRSSGRRRRSPRTRRSTSSSTDSGPKLTLEQRVTALEREVSRTEGRCLMGIAPHIEDDVAASTPATISGRSGTSAPTRTASTLVVGFDGLILHGVLPDGTEVDAEQLHEHYGGTHAYIVEPDEQRQADLDRRTSAFSSLLRAAMAGCRPSRRRTCPSRRLGVREGSRPT